MSENRRRRLPVTLRARAALAALVIPVLIRAVSFARVASWLGSGHPRIRQSHQAFSDAQLARWTDHVLRRLPWLWRHTCLKRAAVLFYILRCADRPVTLQIGVRRDECGAFTAHAWLEHNASIYLEPVPAVPQRHAVIGTFPESQIVDH